MLKELIIEGESVGVVVPDSEVEALISGMDIFIQFNGPKGVDVALVQKIGPGYGIKCFKHSWKLTFDLSEIIKETQVFWNPPKRD